MLRLLRTFIAAAVLAGFVFQAVAFTLLGPNTPWQTPLLAYDLNASLPGFGPMNLGEEYRWNVPTLYYGFTKDFLDYFGERGAQEIDKAIQILTNIPPVSQINLDDYPLGSLRINHRAQTLGLTDLKSFALQVMLYELGVGDPTRFVYSIRNRWTFDTCPPIYYFVIKRNFDPITWQYSSYINGDLWTYTVIFDSCINPGAVLLPEPVDPLALMGYRHSPVSSLRAGFVNGGFLTTLTRDDVAALKYIYRPDNYNMEHIPPGVTGGTNAAFISGGSPWGMPPWLLTNGFGTNLTGGTNGFIEPALRRGIDKVQFVRTDYDSMMGSLFTPITNTYTEQVVLGGKLVSQGIQRIVTIPDILFDASDLQGPDNQPGPWFIVNPGYIGLGWQNNNDINGLADTGNGGPGVILPGATGTPALILTLNRVGPLTGNIWPTLTSEADAIAAGLGPSNFLLWGSFDGSTNAPVIYPLGTSIEAIERQVLGTQ